MLLEFSVSNYRSFANEVKFSLFSARERKFIDRLPYLKSKYKKRVLPVSGIYGPNASGKTNFVEALQYVQRVLLKSSPDRKSLPYNPFKLSSKFEGKPSNFEIVFSLRDTPPQDSPPQDTIYAYTISLTRTHIVKESLYEIRSRDEVQIFERDESGVEVNPKFENSAAGLAAKSVAPVMPVVSAFAAFREDVDHVKLFTAPTRFFERLLVVSAGFLTSDGSAPISPSMSPFLREISAGIEEVQMEEVDVHDIEIPEDEKQKLLSTLNDGHGLTIETTKEKYEVRQKDGNITAYRTRLLHRGEGKPVALEWGEESDGTKAAAKLFPLLSAITRQDLELILVIDEIDRSFHSALTLKILKSFLESCGPDSRNQLIFTTHDLMLMEPKLFRRDEMWLFEKNLSGESMLFSLSEFKDLRGEKDIRKLYINGRLGGTPSLANKSLFEGGPQ